MKPIQHVPATSSLRRWLDHVAGGVRWHLGPAPPAKIKKVDYDEYWESRGVIEPAAPAGDDPWDRPRFEAIASRIQPGERVVDIGCGSGSFMKFMRDTMPIDIIGIDTSQTVVDALADHGFACLQSPLETLDMEALGRVDVAVLADVLEHVVEFEAVLDRVVQHAGRVIISHPNIGFWPHRLRLAAGRFPLQWGWHPGEHVRFFTLRDLVEYFDRANYRVLSLQTPIGVPSPRLRARFPNLCASSVVIEIRSEGGSVP